MDSSNEGSPGLQDQLPQPSIHNLPVELLSHIISLSIQGYSAHLTRVQNLCLVCSKWRDVVEGTPKLWCRLSGADPLPGVRKAIHYSRDYSLDINSHFISHLNGSRQIDFLPAVSLHACRWKRASIVVGPSPGSQNVLQEALTVGKAPRLESLTITSYGRMETPLTLFQGAVLPCLRNLQLRSAPLLWNGEQLFNLQKLEILAEKQTPPPLNDVLSVLRVTRGLEEFAFVGSLSPGVDGDSITVPQHSILLPALKKLRISSVRTSSWLDLFRTIRAPACRRLSLSGDLFGDFEDPNDPVQISEAISQFFPCVRAKADWEERIHIIVGSPEVRFSSSTLDLAFSHSTQRLQLAKWMILNLVDESVEVALYINDPTWNVDQFEVLDLPTLRRAVSKLDVSASVWQRRAILEYLSSPRPGFDDKAQWPLPNLTEITVTVNADDLAVILRMLRGRAGAQAIDLPGFVQPQNIVKLHLTEYTIGSLDTTEILSEIDSLLRGNGGSLTILCWGG